MDALKPSRWPSRCPNCGASAGFMHQCDCGALPYVHTVCDACNTSFKPETLSDLADKEVKSDG